jgi:hypothetical protein
MIQPIISATHMTRQIITTMRRPREQQTGGSAQFDVQAR